MAEPIYDQTLETANLTVEASRICNLCRDMFRKSELLQMSSILGDDDERSRIVASSDSRQEAHLLGYSEDNQDGAGIAEHFIHHKSREDLERSANLGCHVCSLAASACWTLYVEIIHNELDQSEPVSQDADREVERERIIFDPNPPSIVDFFHSTITPFDPDYASSSKGDTTLSRNNFAETTGTSDATIGEQSEKIPANSHGLQLLGDVAVEAAEVRRLKSGIWCKIFRRYDDNLDYKLSFKDYVPYKNRCASNLSILRRPDLSNYASRLSLSTKSDASLVTIKKWLIKCIQTHDGCRSRIFDLKTLPSRLLNVKLDSTDRAIRVEDTARLGVGVQYLALSHCWGKRDIMRLTSSSMAQCYSSISDQILPKTFQDAVEITRRLGYQYLWIDSLCIIQDSGEDWKLESSKMGDIYRNSICCIAALAAKDSEGGCFSMRNPTRYFPCKLGSSGWEEMHMVVEPEKSQYDYSQGTFDVSQKPLWARAWVFQETVLAPRTINFDTEMLYWECSQVSAWENKLEGIKNTRCVKNYLDKIRMLGERANAEPGSEFARQTMVEWSNIVQSYTKGNLTEEKDKLVALSGIASRVQLFTGWKYLAGLWEPSLLNQLFWYNKARHLSGSIRQPGTRPLTYRAPSWSWASIEGDVLWYLPDPDYRWQAKILEENVILKDSVYPFGEVSEGYLRIQGLLQFHHHVKENRKNNMAGTEFEFPSGGSLIIYQDTTCPCQAPCSICRHGIAFLLLGIKEKAPQTRIQRHVKAQIGLVLAQVEGKRDCFSRIGWFLEHLGQRESSFPTYAEMREVIII